ncbi:MAG: MATE family efflux transporter [Erysipelotrichaceae bacterium]|nr:MATE family efflux transporter [Erysipelotrichaceae bacterium]
MEASINRKKVGRNLTEGPILRNLLIFAVPMILTNIIQQLYSIVDLALMGKLVGSSAAVAVNNGSELSDLLLPIATGFSAGGQVLIAQLSGAKDENRIKKAVGTLLTLELLIGVVLAGVFVVFANPLLHLINCPETAFSQAKTYMIITVVGMPFVYIYNAICGILRGMGESKKPLHFVTIASISHILLAYVLVTSFKAEVAGTALATVFSQFLSCALAFGYLLRNREKFGVELKLSSLQFDRESLSAIVSLGAPQSFRTFMVRIGNTWVSRSINMFGLVVSHTNSVGNKLQKLLEVFVQGIDGASGAMIGQNLGAGKTERAGKTTIYTYLCATFFAGCSVVICMLFHNQIYGLFTDEAEVILLGKEYLQIMYIHFFCSALTGSFQAMVTGSGFVQLGFIIGVLDGLVCKIGLSYLFMTLLKMGYKGLWLGVSLSRLIPGMICVGYYLSGSWKTRKILKKKKS